ncbi:hypothetical protein OHD53_29805 [Escherichia coli]|nr:hypothetical protein [Escherichia coli]
MIQGWRWRPPVSPRENPWQADACRKKRATLTRRPLPFLFVMCPECFSDVIFLWLPCLLLFFFFFLFLFLLFFPFLSCLWLFRASPGGAGCRERSQRSCLRPGGLPSLTRNLACSDRSGRAASVAPWPALPASRQKAAGM